MLPKVALGNLKGDHGREPSRGVFQRRRSLSAVAKAVPSHAGRAAAKPNIATGPRRSLPHSLSPASVTILAGNLAAGLWGLYGGAWTHTGLPCPW